MKSGDVYLKQFTIPFTGLKLGQHHFNLKISDKFFEEFSLESITGGSLDVDFLLEKHESWLELFFELNGTVSSSCDRCLGALDVELSSKRSIIVKFGEQPEDSETDDIIWLAESDHQLKIAPYLHELILLEMPMRKVHEEGECDPKMLKRLKSFESFTDEEETETDPRWAVLKKLK